MATFNPQGGVWNPQGGARSMLQAAPTSGLRVQNSPTNAAQMLQPAIAPSTGQRLSGPVTMARSAGQAPAAGGGGAASAGGGGAVASGPTAAQIAEAQRAQEIAGLRGEVQNRRVRANSIFEALTQAVNTLAQEKRGALEAQFQQEQTRATEDFTDKGDELGRVYGARGLADSSYRIDAMDKASRDYQRSLEDLGAQRQSGLAKTGQEAASAIASIGADKGAVDSINLAELNDVGALRNLRADLDERIRRAEVQQTQFGTEAGFRGRIDQIAPYGGTVDALKSALSTLVQSATPKVVKDKLATAIINNYAPGEAEVWKDYYNKEATKATSPTNVA